MTNSSWTQRLSPRSPVGIDASPAARAERELRRAARPLGLLVPRRRVAARGARRARRRARLRGARAHRPRRRLRLARVRARGEGVRRAPDHRRRGDARGGAHVTLLVEPARATRTSAGCSPTRTRTRGRGRRSRRSIPRCRPALLEEHERGARLPLRLRAPRARRRRPERRRAARARVRARALLRRAAAAVRARRRAPQRRACASSPRRSASRPSRPATSTRTTRAATRSRTSLVAIRNRTSLDGCEPERRGNHESVLLSADEMLERFPDDRDAVERTARARRPARVRPDAGARLPLPGLLRRAEPADVQLARICDARLRRALPRTTACCKRGPRAARRGARADRATSGSPASSCSTGRCSSSRARCALEVRGRDSPRHVLPPGRGRGSSVGSIVCYLTGLSHVDPVAADLSLGRFLNRELAAVPDIDLDFPRDIREKLIVARHRALRPRARSARRDVRDLPLARRDPRRRQGARPPVRRARAPRALTDGWNARRVAEELAALPDAERKLLSPRWRAFGELLRARSPACRATSRSTPAGWSSRRARSSSSSPSSRPRWRGGRSASGTRTRAPTRAS